MSKKEYLALDAREMMSILRTAKCIARYDQISHQLLSELLIAIATGGEVIGSNNRGSDVLSPTFGLIEVKSRILGTDGAYPRISLKRHNLDNAAWFAAVRWQRDFTFYDAVMLPKESALKLYDLRKQASGLAHINWQQWISAPLAKSIREECISVLAD
jgi:hypothetical protein